MNTCNRCGRDVDKLYYNANFVETTSGYSNGLYNIDTDCREVEDIDVRNIIEFDETDIVYYCQKCYLPVDLNIIKTTQTFVSSPIKITENDIRFLLDNYIEMEVDATVDRINIIINKSHITHMYTDRCNVSQSLIESIKRQSAYARSIYFTEIDAEDPFPDDNIDEKRFFSMTL